MDYRRITPADADFLVSIFSEPEYAPIFAEEGTTARDWEDRIPVFEDRESNIILHRGIPVGWVMYRIEKDECALDLLVFLTTRRGRGYGSRVLRDIVDRYPIHAVTLDVQKRNTAALAFYEKHGFRITGEELQSVADHQETYYKLRLDLK